MSLELEEPMTRILTTIALSCLVGTMSLSAQMKHVDLKDAKGNSVGMAMVSPAKGGGVNVELDVKGLPPGEHAVHFHAVPKNPEGPHAGDMPNFTVTAAGTAKTTVTNKNVSLADGANSLYANGGTALVIHAAADDMKSDPAGNAGDRIACGTITK